MKIVSSRLMVLPHVPVVLCSIDGACLCTAPATRPSPCSGRTRTNLGIYSCNVPTFSLLHERNARSTMFGLLVLISDASRTAQERHPKLGTIDTGVLPLSTFSASWQYGEGERDEESERVC